MLKKEARKITGGLSKPSKMPGPAHNLPAQACITGAKLVKIPGSVCAGCYALKGRYRFRNVQDALQRRLQALQDPRWVDAMVTLITGEAWFRWHDSGDIQSQEHLKKIFEVCKRTPGTRHWMPTREVKFWPWTSTVTSQDKRTCPAPDQGNECGSCRQCWDRETPNVCYGKH